MQAKRPRVMAGISIFFLICLSAQLKVFAGSSEQHLLKTLQKKFLSIEAYKAGFKMYFKSLNNPSGFTQMAAKGRIYVSGHLLRIESVITATSPARTLPVKMRALFVLTRDALWEMVTNAGSGESTPPFVGKIDLVELKNNFPDIFEKADPVSFFNPAAGVAQIGTDNLHYLGKEALLSENIMTYVLSGSPRILSGPLGFPGESNTERPSTMKIWVGAKDGFTYQTVVKDKSGNVLMRSQLFSVKLNPNLQLQMFTFTPPKDVEPTDMTPITQEMIQRSQPKNGGKQ